MKTPPEVRCVVCRRTFCCSTCRRKHEIAEHNLTYECPICRQEKFLCSDKNMLDVDLLRHIENEHLPLHCNRCGDVFTTYEELLTMDKCYKTNKIDNSNMPIDIDARFQSLYEKTKAELSDNDADMAAIISFDTERKTASVTPIVKNKVRTMFVGQSEHKRIRSPATRKKVANPMQFNEKATPHVRKFLMRQACILSVPYYNNYDSSSTETDEQAGGISGVERLGHSNNTRTTSRHSDDIAFDLINDIRTPVVRACMNDCKSVKTSTPTNSSMFGMWIPFPGGNNNSSLSEIGSGRCENTAGNDTDQESPKIISNDTGAESKPKLKSIIVTSSKSRVGSQDSIEKQVTFIDSPNCSPDSNSNIKKTVKFAEDTKFVQVQGARKVFRRPKRNLTPGPQKVTRQGSNSKFQAILNQFEPKKPSNVYTPMNRTAEANTLSPPEYKFSSVLPARAIDFKLKNDSPTTSVEENDGRVQKNNKVFKFGEEDRIDVFKPSSVAKPLMFNPQPGTSAQSDVEQALTAFSANVAGSIQSYLKSTINNCEETTAINFQIIITKQNVSVKKLPDNQQAESDKTSSKAEFRRDTNKERGGIWSVIVKAIKSVLWGGEEDNSDSDQPKTPANSKSEPPSQSSSGKRRLEEEELHISPLNHKRYKYDGVIQARRPIRRMIRQNNDRRALTNEMLKSKGITSGPSNAQ